MVVYLCLERKQGEKLLKGKGILSTQSNTVTTYLEKKDAVQALKKQLNISSKNDKFERIDFMLFEYHAENVKGFDHPEDIAEMKKVYCDNYFPIKNLLTAESLYFYLDKNNRIRYKRSDKYKNPYFLEELRKEIAEMFPL